MIETVPKEIDGTTYHLHTLGARDGRHMLVRLTKVLGPSVGRLAESTVDPKGQGGKGLAEAVAGAIYELSEHLSEADLDWICEKFGNRTEIDQEGGKRHLLDLELQELHFAGRFGTMIKWLAACLEVNFADFFAMSASAAKTAGLGGAGKALEAASSRQSPPESSPGSSGRS